MNIVIRNEGIEILVDGGSSSRKGTNSNVTVHRI